MHSLRRPLSWASTIFCAILTLFPDAVKPYLDESILGIAQDQGTLQIEFVDFRSFATDRHKTVDDRPFGGGPGMVMKPEPIFDAVEATEQRHGPLHKVLLCPRGTRYTQAKARALAADADRRLLILCGRYEGFDERIRDGIDWDEISLGDFVLAGGELPALCLIESVARLLPGVLGCAESATTESFETELFDYPQYTRPREFRGFGVPEVLLSGDHGAIAEWRRRRAEQLTAAHRAGDRIRTGDGARTPARDDGGDSTGSGGSTDSGGQN